MQILQENNTIKLNIDDNDNTYDQKIIDNRKESVISLNMKYDSDPKNKDHYLSPDEIPFLQ